jgi:two-component system sensor histidine kinase CpxA
MHSLYWRIFLAFWVALALILVGTVTVAVNVALQHRAERPWVLRGQLFAQAARAFEDGGPEALKAWLESLKANDFFSRTYVVTPSGQDMLNRPLPGALNGQTGASVPIAPIGGALVLVTADGSTYHVVVGPVRESPRLFGELELPGVPTATLLIALGVSAAICFLLARYLVAPVDRLRRATRRMAGGDLNVRVLPTLHGRQDDLALLAADLDTMAERLRTLLETKQQLLRDVSHELRSPLARLQLALTLAMRDPSAAERQLKRIAREADRLEELISRTLALARLEIPAHSIERSGVSVGELLASIVDDVTIEADARGCPVSLRLSGEVRVSGDPELLRSMFENVIRNAVQHSPAGGPVGITVTPGDDVITIQVRDHGRGVPEEELKLIFEPFYRVDKARDPAEGGAGLGLAIAQRAVDLHGGFIEARNAASGGLIVSIKLPMLDRVPRPGSAGSRRGLTTLARLTRAT